MTDEERASMRGCWNCLACGDSVPTEFYRNVIIAVDPEIDADGKAFMKFCVTCYMRMSAYMAAHPARPVGIAQQKREDIATARAEGHAAGVAEERARWRAAVRVQRVVYEAMGARYALDALRAILRTCDADGGEAG